jgi:hypothetical protein
VGADLAAFLDERDRGLVDRRPLDGPAGDPFVVFGDQVHQVNGARQTGRAAAHEEDVYGHTLALDL